MKPVSVASVAAVAALATTLFGCNLPALTIKGTVDATRQFTEAHGTEFADPEMVGPVLATATVTNEGLIYFVPDYEPLLLGAIFSNVAYGVGWLQAESADAVTAGKYDEAEHLNKRAGLLFARALFYSKRMLRLRDDGFDAAIAGGNAKFRIWIDEHFYEKNDAEVLLVAALGYFTSMVSSPDGLAAAVDIPYARYMIERSVELNPDLQGGQGLAVLGTIECTVPEMLGGRPHLGLKLLERAAAGTSRGNHGVLVTIAEKCAVALQDRELFHKTLMEVIETGDVPKYRIGNKLARHNAERLLKQMGDLFYD